MKAKTMDRHKWTEEEREIVRRDYRGTHASAREIADRLGVSEYGVRRQVAMMGLGKKSDRKCWDPAQDDQLRELLLSYAARTVSRKMGRNLNSVVIRAKRLGLHRRNRDGWFTKKEVGEILGMDHHWIQRRIDSGALKATYHNGQRPSQRG